jgi:hypothetical protein
MGQPMKRNLSGKEEWDNQPIRRNLPGEEECGS